MKTTKMSKTRLNGKALSRKETAAAESAVDGVVGTENRIEYANNGVPVLVNVEPASVDSDFPVPMALQDRRPFLWNADQPAAVLYPQFANRLQQVGDLYRLPGYGSGLLLASACPDVPPAEITKGAELAPVITDRLPVLVIKDGKSKGSRIPAADLNCMVRSELFLARFRAVDQVVKRPMYLGEDFQLTRPGYNDCGRGQRVYYVGEDATVSLSPDAINRFLDVMQFRSNADRTNAVAAALTVTLRNFWRGRSLLFSSPQRSPTAGRIP